MRIKGIIAADRPCECCGNTNLERLVVIEKNDGSTMYVGSTCAGYMVMGVKSRKNATEIETRARAVEYANKWTAKHGNSAAVLTKIADAIRVRFCGCDIVDGAIVVTQPQI